MAAPGAAHLLAGASCQRIDWIDFHSAILAGEGGRCQWEDGSLLFDEVRACYGLQQFALPFPSHVQTLFDVLDQAARNLCRCFGALPDCCRRLARSVNTSRTAAGCASIMSSAFLMPLPMRTATRASRPRIARSKSRLALSVLVIFCERGTGGPVPDGACSLSGVKRPDSRHCARCSVGRPAL